MRKNKLIKIINGVDLMPNIFKYSVILFPMGINNSTNNGLSYEIALNFPEVKESENETGYGNLNKLGTIHETFTNNMVFIACYIHKGGYEKDANGSFLNYEALEQCLSEINYRYNNEKIATIPLGCYPSDGNGDKDKVLRIFNKVFTNNNVTIYDYELIDYKLRIFREIAEVRKKFKEKEITRKEYFKIRSEIEWRRKNGIFAIQPKDYEYIPKKNKNKLRFRGSKEQY